jgi:hypothetical protein
MKSKEERAEIARQNGAKSRGPVTPEGKERSRRNAIKHGARAEALGLFVPPHSALLAPETRQQFYAMLDENIAQYRPVGKAQIRLVREITDCQWIIGRYRTIDAHLWNVELLRQPVPSATGIPEFQELDTLVRLSARAIKDLKSYMIATQRQLRDLQRHYPAPELEPASSRQDRADFQCPEPERTHAPEPAEDSQLPVITTTCPDELSGFAAASLGRLRTLLRSVPVPVEPQSGPDSRAA